VIGTITIDKIFLMPKTSNKNIIRKELVSGKFTTIHHSILFDTNLTPTAFKVLSVILSDSDTNFNVTQGALIKRLKMHKDTIKAALENLEKCGYLRRVVPKFTKRGHFYIIDEASRLNNNNYFNKILGELGYAPIEEKLDEVVMEQEQVISTNEDENLSQRIDKNRNLLDNYLLTIQDILTFEETNADYFLALEQQYTDSNGLVDYYKIKPLFDKEIVAPLQKECYKFGMEALHKIGGSYPNKVKNAYTKWLKEQIYEAFNLSFNAEKELRRFNRELNKPKLDYETLSRDKAEEEYYDNLSMY
jgi:DNA-binding MarR family transcriptional regulator